MNIDEEDPPIDDCDHIDTGRVRKYDGGRLSLLCARCYVIVGTWRPDDPA